MTRNLLRPHALPIAGVLLSALAFYPGFLSFDSAYQFWQIRSGEYSNIAPVTMTALWALVHAVWPGSGGVFLIHIAAFWAGLWLAACALFSGRRARIAATLALALLSPALLIVAHLWTDAALVASLTLGTALILAAVRHARPALLYAALPCLLYGGMVRHNALLALLPLAVLWFAARAELRAPGAPLSRLRLTLGALLACIAVFVAGTLLDRAMVVHRVKTFAVVQLWDLAAISIAERTMLLPDFVRPANLTVDHLAAKYTPFANVPLYSGEWAIADGFGHPFDTAQIRQLNATWLAAIRTYPGAYLAHRWALTRALFSRYRNDRPQSLAFVPTIVSYRDNPYMKANSSIFNRLAMRWYRESIGWWISAPLPYLLLALGCGLLAWRRSRTQSSASPAPPTFNDRFALACALSGLFYTLPLILAAPAAELRYSSWLFVTALLAALALYSPKHLAGAAPDRFQRPAPGSATASDSRAWPGNADAA